MAGPGLGARPRRVYDHEGNRVSRTRISPAPAGDYLTTYSWDYRDRLTDVKFLDNNNHLTKQVHYVYDVFDHLIGKQVDPTGGGTYTSSAWYALDLPFDPNAPALPVLQFDGSGNETYRFLDGPTAGGVDAVMTVYGQEAIGTQGSAGTTTDPLTDNLGTVRLIVDTTSAIVDELTYTSFGQVAQESGTVAHWVSFAGYHLDADTGLYYVDHRWYDAVTARWMSEDPIGFAGGDMNVTRYVGNGTTNLVDPAGLTSINSGPTGFWNSLGNSIWSMGQTYVGIYYQMTGNSYDAQIAYNNAYQNGPLGQTQNSSGVYYYGTRGALACSTAAMSAAMMAWAWAAAGMPTWAVNWGPGAAWYGHVSFGVTPWGGGPIAWYQAVGAWGTMWVIHGAPTATWLSVTGVPILFPVAAVSAPYAWNCATAACNSLWHGWFYYGP